MPAGRPDWTGRVNVIVIEQQTALYDPRDWAAKEAEDKDFLHTTWLNPAESKYICIYAVPAGKMLLIADVAVYTEVKCHLTLIAAGVGFFRAHESPYTTRSHLFSKPKVVDEGESLCVYTKNDDTVAGSVGCGIGGLEIPAVVSSSSSLSNPRAKRVTDAWREGDFNSLTLEVGRGDEAELVLLKREWHRPYKAKLRFLGPSEFDVLEDELIRE